MAKNRTNRDKDEIQIRKLKYVCHILMQTAENITNLFNGTHKRKEESADPTTHGNQQWTERLRKWERPGAKLKL